MVLVEAKVRVQGVVALGSHFETLYQEVNFYEVFFSLSIFKKKGKYIFSFNHSYSKKSSNKAPYHKSATYYDPQSSGINVQSLQSESTPKRLNLDYALEFLNHKKPI